MRSKILFISISLILTATNCSSDQKVISTKNLKSYYYPVEDLNQPKVYYYKSEKELNRHLFWKLSKKEENGVTYLITDAFTYGQNGEIQKVEEIKERITKEGSFVVNYVQYEHDDLGNTFKLNSTMKDSCVFKWEMTSDEKIDWSFRNESMIFPNYTRSISKKRSLENVEEKFEYKGENKPAVLFSDHLNTKYTNINTGSIDNAFEMDQISFYAKDIGMTKYTRKFEDGSDITFELYDILTMHEWNEKLGK